MRCTDSRGNPWLLPTSLWFGPMLERLTAPWMARLLPQFRPCRCAQHQDHVGSRSYDQVGKPRVARTALLVMEQSYSSKAANRDIALAARTAFQYALKHLGECNYADVC